MTTLSIHLSTIVPVEPITGLTPAQQPKSVQGEKTEKQEKIEDVQQTQTQLAKDQREMFNAGVTSGGVVTTHQGKEIEGTEEKPNSKKQEPDNSKDTKTTEGSNSSSSSSMYSSSTSSFFASSCQTSSASLKTQTEQQARQPSNFTRAWLKTLRGDYSVTDCD